MNQMAAKNSMTADQLYRTAKYQRVLMWVVLINFLGFALICALTALGSETDRTFYGALFVAFRLIILVAGAICILGLARAMENWWFLYILLLLIPCLGLLAMLHLSSLATIRLRKNDIKVGLMGPSAASVEMLKQRAEEAAQIGPDIEPETKWSEPQT